MVANHPLLSVFEIRGYANPSANVFQQGISEENCPACGVLNSKESPSEATIWVGNGSRWTDIISNIDCLLLHERVVEVLERSGISGFQAYPVKINKVNSNKLTSISAPKYYLIDILGRIDVDVTQLDDLGGSVCPACFARNAIKGNRYRWKTKNIIPDLDTWDGSDFTKIRNWRTKRNYCSKRFIDLASEHKWTNFVFGESVPGVGLWEKPQHAINGLSYKDKNWFEKLSEQVKEKHSDLFA